jgi:hypothetical protein
MLPPLPQGHAPASWLAVPQLSGLTTYHGSCWASTRRPGKTTTPPPLRRCFILPGQFLDSPELPSETFLEQFSKTLSAAEHPSTRHNTTAARRPPPKLPDALAHATNGVRLGGWTIGMSCHSSHSMTVPKPFFAAPTTTAPCDKEDKVSIHLMKPCSYPTALPAQSRARDRPPAIRFRDFSLPGIAQEPRREPFPPGQPPLPGGLHAPPLFQFQQQLGQHATAQRRTD